MLSAAIVGMGWWGKQIVSCLDKSETIKIVRGVEVEPDRVAAFRQYLETLGLSLGGGQAVRPPNFAQLIHRLKGRKDADVVQNAILRCQAQAVYSPDNLGHFGLALRNYAHFTSPIRRYSDLLVHRALIRGLGLGEGALEEGAGDKFGDIGVHISMTERRAMAAERGCCSNH